MKIINSERGFTIVELLVVIVVIAILVALTLPNLFGLQRRARDDDRKNDLKNLQSALETYYNDNNSYVDSTDDLVAQYIDAVPTDPNGGAYTYTPAPGGCTTAGDNCTSYTLSADLENDNDPQADANGNYVINSVNQ
ncbi:prepilin-type N-terminal cleavage/methylation domain-containing protein [Candidatus Microgenomates bacterium]|nr:prepilin-type N-terminal cleavage/methylation domain-containing protein [Candidatus Microgenomates bacterium]